MSLLQQLTTICEANRIDDKVLLAPGYRQGRNLCEALARSSGAALNLRVETIEGLARAAARDSLAAGNWQLIDSGQAASLVESAFRELAAAGLHYYRQQGGLQRGQGLIKALTASLLELRRCGLKAALLPDGAFVTPEKGKDLRLLLAHYERLLAERRLVDPPGLVTLALSLLRGRKDSGDGWLYLLPDFLRLYPPERELLRLLAGERVVILSADQAVGEEAAGQCAAGIEPEHLPQYTPGTADLGRVLRGEEGLRLSDVQRLCWLDRPAEAPAAVRDGSLKIFQAYGLTNEVRESLRRVVAAGVPLDQVTLAYAGPEYLPALIVVCSDLQLGWTSADGVPAALTAPGKLLQGLIDWIGSDFSAAVIRELLLEGVLQQTDAMEAAALLRSAGIGWGRERYALLLRQAEMQEAAGRDADNPAMSGSQPQTEDQLTEASQGEDAAGEQALTAGLGRALAWMLEQLPQPDAHDGCCSLREFSRGLAAILEHCSHIGNDIDRETLAALSAALYNCARLVDFRLGREELLERAGRILRECSAAGSGPLPGMLYLTGCSGLLWSDRLHTLILGLDSSFPGSGRQDPVLLDQERRAISAALPLAADAPRLLQEELQLALASREGSVTLSFACYDPVGNRSLFPAAVLLKAYRLLADGPELDYSHLLHSLAWPAGFAPAERAEALDEGEWWLAALAGGVPPGAHRALACCYPSIAAAGLAAAAREDPSPGGYDGAVQGRFDPRISGAVLSCSALEQLARCPFAYFLRYQLGISPPEEVEYDPARWLPADLRGLLFHDLFCRFLRQLAAAGRSLDAEEQRQLLQRLAEGLIEDYRQQLPPPSELVFQQETEEIRRSGDLFLRLLQSDEGTPLYFEVPFGMKPDAEADALSLRHPVELPLGDGRRLRLQGRIDRIDRLRDGSYTVWDYKSGRCGNYSEAQPFRQGRHVQHALYSLAAEQLLDAAEPGRKHLVLRSGYLFPTIRGEGKRVPYREERQTTLELVNLLCDLLASGMFVYTDDDGDCRFCDYQAVCGGGAAARGKELLANEAESRLEPLRRLKQYG